MIFSGVWQEASGEGSVYERYGVKDCAIVFRDGWSCKQVSCGSLSSLLRDENKNFDFSCNRILQCRDLTSVFEFTALNLELVCNCLPCHMTLNRMPIVFGYVSLSSSWLKFVSWLLINFKIQKMYNFVIKHNIRDKLQYDVFAFLFVWIVWWRLELSLLRRTKELAIENEDLKKELDENKKKCYEMESTL
jgi:hypothetical protein